MRMLRTSRRMRRKEAKVNWLNSWLDPIATPFFAMALLFVFAMSFTNSGLRRRLRNKQAMALNMTEELMRLGVKVSINESDTVIKFSRTHETEAFKQAYYIGSQWNLDRILDTQNIEDERCEAATFVEVIKKVTGWKDANSRAKAIEVAEEAEEQAMAGLEYAVDDLAQVMNEYEAIRGIDTLKPE